MRIASQSAPKVWIDLDNSPHVPFFAPIIEELKGRGFSVVLTARDCSNVRELLQLFQLNCPVTGKHYGKAHWVKAAATCWRALQLLRVGAWERPDIAISHGSRSQLLCCSMLGIPTITIFDYEFANLSLYKCLRFSGRNWLMAPQIISGATLNGSRSKLLHYPGIKEDVYVPMFKQDPTIKSELGFGNDQLVVTIRPPAMDAHYFNPESETLFIAVMNRLIADSRTKIVLLPRNEKQKAQISDQWRSSFDTGKVIIPDRPVDGLNLIWHSDLVVSGGGTMNREAAALRVPVYSIFRGPIGAVDRYLAGIGRLILIESAADVNRKIALEQRCKTGEPGTRSRETLDTIIENVNLVMSKFNPALQEASL